MSYRLNLDLSPKRFTHGSVELWLNWTNEPDGSGVVPAMMFTKKNSDRRQVVGLRLSEIHNYINNSGYGMAGLVHMGMQIAESIGCAAGDKFAGRDVADLIVEYTEDLVNMPPFPPEQHSSGAASTTPKAELSIQIDGQTVLETEVET